MLIITDQLPGGIGREGRLPRTGEAEEEGDISVRPLISRTVHREDIPLGEVVVQNREDRLLDLTGIEGTTDQDDLRSEEHTSELQSRGHLVCRLLLEKKKTNMKH